MPHSRPLCASSATATATKMPLVATTTVEHVVLFKVCGSADLVSLNFVSHLIAGLILRHRLHPGSSLASPISSTPAMKGFPATCLGRSRRSACHLAGPRSRPTAPPTPGAVSVGGPDGGRRRRGTWRPFSRAGSESAPALVHARRCACHLGGPGLRAVASIGAGATSGGGLDSQRRRRGPWQPLSKVGAEPAPSLVQAQRHAHCLAGPRLWAAASTGTGAASGGVQPVRGGWPCHRYCKPCYEK